MGLGEDTSLGFYVSAAPARTRNHKLQAYVTGYNTVVAQTDDTPCIAAYICGRRDVVACPSDIKLGTIVEIRERSYTCEDHTGSKFNKRFDISCDKDKDCPYPKYGMANSKSIRRMIR